MTVYRTELLRPKNQRQGSEYGILTSADGVLVRGDDRVFLDRVVDLLNADEASPVTRRVDSDRRHPS